MLQFVDSNRTSCDCGADLGIFYLVLVLWLILAMSLYCKYKMVILCDTLDPWKTLLYVMGLRFVEI